MGASASWLIRVANVLLTRQKVTWLLIADSNSVVRSDVSGKTEMEEKAGTVEDVGKNEGSSGGRCRGTRFGRTTAVIIAIFDWSQEQKWVIDISADHCRKFSLEFTMEQFRRRHDREGMEGMEKNEEWKEIAWALRLAFLVL